MKKAALVIAVAALPFAGGTAAGASPAAGAGITSPAEAGQAIDAGARKKMRRDRHVHRTFRGSYGYGAPYSGSYYRGVRPGWGYGPDPGDYAWPPFHFKPYW